MPVITFCLETQQPILATSFQGDPNSDVSYAYIPGSMIRGALIGRYLKSYPELPNDIFLGKVNQGVRENILEEVEEENTKKLKEANRLFFDNSTRYLNAYLFCEKQKKRTLPVPLAWYKNKDEEFSSADILDLSQFAPGKISLKKNSERFCNVNKRQVVLYEEKRRINIHNLRDRIKGRSSPTKRDRDTNEVIQEGEGAIFRYEALDVGQIFQGVILCEDDDVKMINILLNSADIWLGGSQSAGYGHTKIIQVDTYKSEEWAEIGIPPQERVNRQKLRITLLSDTIVRNDYGQVSVDPVSIKQAIEDKLQEKLKIKIQLPQPTDIFISSTLVGGFNRKWGLPLPQVTALSAGSVFVFDAQLTTEQIQILEIEGIGERCIDGFGRVAINWLEEYRNFSVISNRINCENEIQLEDEYQDLAAQIAKNILRQRLEKCLIDRISEINLKGDISNSQLYRLEIVARQGLNKLTFLPIIELLSSLTDKVIEQYRNTKVSGNKSLEQQLKDWLESPIGESKSWLKNPQELEVNIAGIIQKIEPDSDLAREYTLRLIMAVAKKAKKEKSQ
ncbi:CRISPR-associated RAMP protein Csx10 [Scytonema sp. NUACC21]